MVLTGKAAKYRKYTAPFPVRAALRRFPASGESRHSGVQQGAA
jgi:hypothetical protein